MFYKLLEQYENSIKESGVKIDERAHIDRVAFADWLNNHAVQQGVQLTGLYCPECGTRSFAGTSCEQCGFPYLRPATNA